MKMGIWESTVASALRCFFALGVLTMSLEATGAAQRAKSGSSSSRRVASGPAVLKVSPILSTEFLLTTDATSDGLNKGWGYALGGQLDMPIGEGGRWTLIAAVKYVGWNITRTVAPSSEITTPSDLYEHQLAFIAWGLAAGYRLGLEDGRSFRLVGGMEFLTPISASQSRNGGASTSFSNTQKPLLLVFGADTEFPMSESWSFTTVVSAFYNLSANQGAKLFGIRGQIGFNYSL